jgi:Ca2+-binding RTX toxin-like protein
MSDNNATIATDNITQTGGPDTLTVTDSNQFQGTDFFDGGLGTDAIVIGTLGAGVIVNIIGLPDATHGFHNYEAITFKNTSGFSAVSLAAVEFGAGLISSSLALTGVNGSSQNIGVGGASNFSAANWTFTNWETTDIVAIQGTVGADTIIGSIKTDALDGTDGADILTGGLGKDSLTGGIDADTFDFNRKSESVKGINRDIIQDFSGLGLEGDHIDVHDIDAKKGVAGNQNFHFIGTHKFHHKAGELHFVKHGTFVTVEGDVNGDGKADFQIEVHNLANNLNSLAPSDFVL